MELNMTSGICGRIKLPFQGAPELKPFKSLRRCRWAELSWAFSPPSKLRSCGFIIRTYLFSVLYKKTKPAARFTTIDGFLFFHSLKVLFGCCAFFLFCGGQCAEMAGQLVGVIFTGSI